MAVVQHDAAMMTTMMTTMMATMMATMMTAIMVTSTMVIQARGAGARWEQRGGDGEMEW